MQGLEYSSMQVLTHSTYSFNRNHAGDLSYVTLVNILWLYKQ